MLLTISTTHVPATDLGYLLHKHPDRVQEFAQSFGTATVLYPEASEERCTAALVLAVDPFRLARSRTRSPDFSLAQYVNDRSYAASSLLGVALADVFSTARAGICKSRQELADSPIPLELHIPVLPCRGGPDVAHRLFAPLGWDVDAEPIPLDPELDWGASRYVRLTLAGTVRLADALNQLHVLLPVLDESKHYWQGPDEVDKLLRSGGSWLVDHPERDLIARRYLGHSRGLAADALARLAELGDDVEAAFEPEPAVRRVALNVQRHEAVLGVLDELGARSVLDLGCGPGRLLQRLAETPGLDRITGVDVSSQSLKRAARRLRLERMGERQAERITLVQGALTYTDERFAGYDAAVLMEVVEHVDPERLPAFERVVFGQARPAAVVLTTPNREFNERFEGLVGFRHPDHRFEWTRAEFAAWCEQVCRGHGYSVEIRGVGDPDPDLGAPTQMGVFRRA